MKSIERAIVIISLVFFLLLLCSYSGLFHNQYHPSFSYQLNHFQQYQNKSITITGVITEQNLDNNTVSIKINEVPYQNIWVTIPSLEDKKVKSGDSIEVSGKLITKQHILADNSLITPSWMHDLIYIRSIPAIPLVLFFFFKKWRFNRTTCFFERRNP